MIGFPQKNFRKSLNRDFVTDDFVTLRRFNIVGVEFYYIYINIYIIIIIIILFSVSGAILLYDRCLLSQSHLSQSP